MGKITINKDLIPEWIWRNDKYLKAFLFILFNTNDEGMFSISLRETSKELNYPVGLTRHFIKLLVKEKLVTKINDAATQVATQVTTHLNICNIENYKDQQHSLKHSLQHTPGTKPGKGKKPGGGADFINQIIGAFSNLYEEKRGSKYYVTSMGKERSAAGKLAALYKKNFPDSDTGSALNGLGLFFSRCLDAPDNWLYNNCSLPIIYSHINKYINYIKNGDRKKQGTTDAELANIIAKLYADGTR